MPALTLRRCFPMAFPMATQRGHLSNPSSRSGSGGHRTNRSFIGFLSGLIPRPFFCMISLFARGPGGGAAEEFQRVSQSPGNGWFQKLRRTDEAGVRARHDGHRRAQRVRKEQCLQINRSRSASARATYGPPAASSPPEKHPSARRQHQDARVLANLLARRGNAGFPMIGKYFSNGWKISGGFSNDWKNFSAVFQ